MDFDEWWDENGELYRRPTPGERYSFEAGQQSKQAEIEHRTQVSAELAGELIRKRAEIDALKEKLKKLEDHTFINYDYERDDDQHSYWSGYNVALGEIAAIIEENNNDT